MDKIYSRRQAAEMLGLSEQTVDRLRQTGMLKSVRLSVRRVGIPASSLEAYVRLSKTVSIPFKEQVA